MRPDAFHANAIMQFVVVWWTERWLMMVVLRFDETASGLELPTLRDFVTESFNIT